MFTLKRKQLVHGSNLNLKFGNQMESNRILINTVDTCAIVTIIQMKD